MIAGTRPEIIKLAPIYHLAKSDPDLDVKFCATGQHDALAKSSFDFFNITPDYDLGLMTANQSINALGAAVLSNVTAPIETETPDWVMVQGDTTSALMGALAAYGCKKSVVHIEAGLRTGDKWSPFPEECNRRLISGIADWHFAPTSQAVENLKNEGINAGIYEVGNTVVDAAILAFKQISKNQDLVDKTLLSLNQNPFVLVTMHRRENFGRPHQNICNAISKLASQFPDILFLIPVHPNPQVEAVVRSLKAPNIRLTDPLSYPSLIWAIAHAKLILTDSGGIQEEAPQFDTPVLVLRENTERPEGLDAGVACLVGTDPTQIISQTIHLLTDSHAYDQMATAQNPFGDGTAATQVLAYLKTS